MGGFLLWQVNLYSSTDWNNVVLRIEGDWSTKNRGGLLTGDNAQKFFNNSTSSEFLDQINGFLSNKEKEVLSLILEGLSTQEISSKLFISINTVKTHITNIYRKLKIKGRKDLLKLAVNGNKH